MGGGYYEAATWEGGEDIGMTSLWTPPTLDASDAAIVEQIRAQMFTLTRGNATKQSYYDQDQAFKDLRISTPPQVLQDLRAVLGWPAKAVDVLSDRINFASFVTPDDADTNPFGLNDIATANHFRAEFAGATSSTLINSCAFLSVTQAEGSSEPLWLSHSAMWASGLWDRTRRALKAGLAVTEWDGNNEPSRFVVFLPSLRVEYVRRQGRWVISNKWRNHTGRVQMVRVAYAPNIRRPFGRSRISKAVRYFSDAAARTIVRSEIGAEFFASPQRYGIGIDGDDMDKWTALLGRFFTATRDEEGELPQLGQFPQHSMQPHVDHLRMWVNLFAAETSIPVSELGFVSDNPASDAAIQSQRDPLRGIANAFIRDNQPALAQLAEVSVMLRDGLSEPPAGIEKVAARFEPTVHLTDAARADALLKQATVFPWLAESPVALEMAGYDAATIERLLADKARASGGTALNKLLAAPVAEPTPETDELAE